MSKYVLKFTKEGYFRYTSHLDLLRFFKRSLKRANVKLVYSQGFNPHPKIGFAQPLSLGYESEYELLEYETAFPEDEKKMMRGLEVFMPEGLNLLELKEYKEPGKSLASMVTSAQYEIRIPLGEVLQGETAEYILSKCSDFSKEDEIFALKKKKKGREKELVSVNIAQMIRKLEFGIEGEFLKISALLDAGSDSNLSPELLISSLLEYLKFNIARDLIFVKRKKIFFLSGYEI